MYTQHFHLKELPFSIAPNPRYLYLSPKHREALAHLLYGIGVGGGFVVLSGEVGTGKTTLCRALLDQLPEDVDLALIFNPRLNSRELLAGICDELHVPYSGPKASLKQLIDALNQFLLETHARGRRVIVLIDEAQNLRFDVLEQIRLLTNLETNQAKLLQIILVGQPELNQVLDRPNLRQLAQRVTARYHLQPLSRREAQDYLEHRMLVAGSSEDVFTPGAVRTIHRKSRGIPRLINLIADRALLGAYTQGKFRVDARTASKAAGELLSRSSGNVGLKNVKMATVVISVLLGAVLLNTGGLEQILARFGQPMMELQRPSDRGQTDPPLPSPLDGASQSERLGVWLGGPDMARRPALEEVIRLWLPDYRLDAREPCSDRERHGLSCYQYHGAWNDLVRLNLPVAVEFVQPGGGRRYAALVGVEGDAVRLSRRGVAAKSFPKVEVLSNWSGRAIVIWKPPSGADHPLKPGMSSPLVSWVRQQLGLAEQAASSSIYDPELESRVAAFQRGLGLRADGVMGTLTLIGLEGNGYLPGIPHLIESASESGGN